MHAMRRNIAVYYIINVIRPIIIIIIMAYELSIATLSRKR